MRDLPIYDDPNLLVGAQTFSDAGVYRLRDDLAIVQSLDFFAPLVDDPFVFGQIAAANALSDLYAMGATPTTCMNIVGFPDKDADPELLHQILAGGAERATEAGAVVVGGHSVRDHEIKYGMSVTGVVDPAQMLTNERAQVGDVLVLTKGLGTGVITTALCNDRCPENALSSAIQSMVRLNADASRLALELMASAATDITGFGFLGHAMEMATASGVTLEIEAGTLPILAGAEELATEENRSGASTTNREAIGTEARIEGVGGARAELLFDPQTSGGLLVAIASKPAEEFVRRAREAGDSLAVVVGKVIEHGNVRLEVS